MIGRFIIECDPEHFDVACEAAKFLFENPRETNSMTSQTDGDGGNEVRMFAKRLKKSIHIKQVHP